MVPPCTADAGSAGSTSSASSASGADDKNKSKAATDEKEVSNKESSSATQINSSAADTPETKEPSPDAEKEKEKEKDISPPASEEKEKTPAVTAASESSVKDTASKDNRGVDTPQTSKNGGGGGGGGGRGGQEYLSNGLPKIVYDLPSSSSHASKESPKVYLDASDSHLDLQIDKNNPLTATCMHTGGFQYMWKGVRASSGIKKSGKYYFEVHVGPKPAAVVMPDTPLNTQHVCRVGVSQPLTSLHLGDSAESWGFGGTGKKSTNRRYLDYGTSFGEGDVIGVAIDLDNLTLSFKKNKEYLGAAFDLPPAVRETGLFPHIYVKNFNFTVNFNEKSKWFDPPGPQFKFIGDLEDSELMPNPVEHPKNVGECEFIMMCGLPACGKTYWIEKHMERYPKKSYVLLGTNAVIDQMKVMGLKRQANYANRWEELMSTATEVFNSLVSYAGSGAVPRNVIIDQTNVFKRARARKVQPFLGWGVRRCVVMVTDEPTLQHRTQKREREEGKMVPVSAVMDMKAAFALPAFDDGFTVIDYVEMPEQESRREIRRINEEGRAFKANNPGMNNRQPKPHIEARGGYGDADASAAKRHKADHWQGGPPGGPPHSSWGAGGGPGGPYQSSWGGGAPPQSSWGAGGPHGGPHGGPPGGRGDWGDRRPQQQQQQHWGGGGPQGGWQQHGNSGGGRQYASGGGGYGYGGYNSGAQGYDSSYQQQQQQQQYYGRQQGYDSNYYADQRQQQGVYDSRHRQGGQQQYQETYASNGGWSNPHHYSGGGGGGGGSSMGGYYQQRRY